MKEKRTSEEVIMELGEKLHDKISNVLDDARFGKHNRNSHTFNQISINDIVDLVKYSYLVYSGQLRAAQKLQRNLDTAVYEAIPIKLWEKIEYGEFLK